MKDRTAYYAAYYKAHKKQTPLPWRRCAFCGKAFQRRRALYCSTSYKLKAYRARASGPAA